jgi:hypothetical protein
MSRPLLVRRGAEDHPAVGQAITLEPARKGNMVSLGGALERRVTRPFSPNRGSRARSSPLSSD